MPLYTINTTTGAQTELVSGVPTNPQWGAVSPPAAAVAPSISDQSEDQSVCEDGTLSLFVVATGDAPLTYQWKKGGVDIPGATSSTYTLTPVLTSSGGTYTCVVTNAEGSATSADIVVTVLPTVDGHLYMFDVPLDLDSESRAGM